MTFRVVLDTDVLVSGYAYPSGITGKIITAWEDGALGVMLSHHILAEMIRILQGLKQSPYNAAQVLELAEACSIDAEIVGPAAIPEGIVRDASDAPVLGTLLASGADYLITGDKDLLALAEQYPILTPAAFWQRYGD